MTDPGPPAYSTGGAAAGTDSGTTIYSHSITNPNTGQMGYSGNGSLQYAADSVNGTWSYVYDDFNRLITSTCTANCPQNPSGLGFTYVYDRYGNRWQQNLTAGTGGQPQYSFMSGNNRISGSGVVYDSAGNVWKDGLGDTFSYDGENRISSVNNDASVYVYDAEGLRVRKTTGGTSVDYIFDLSGHPVAEVSSTGSWNRGEVYAGGRHLATYSGGASGAMYFPYTDWLGTERARATVGGAVCESISSLPYGDGQVSSGGCGDPSPMHFTGKQRDTETGLDDFGARYYSSLQGRWYSPDWASAQVPVPYADLHNPQSLNLYDYVGGDPTNHADADGHLCTNPGTGCGSDQAKPAQDSNGQASAQTAQNEINTKPPTPKPPHQTFVGSHSKLASFLQKHVPGFSAHKFNAAVGNMTVVDVPNRSQGAGTLPLTTLTRNVQDLNTPVANAIPFGAAATTLTDAPGRPILLGPELYGPAAYPHSEAEQNADMVHEELHSATGASDAQIFQWFHLDPTELQFGHTGPISDAIRDNSQ